MRLQAACMTAQMPQGRAVYEGDPAAAAALMAAWPGEYRLGPEGAARTDARWTAFWATAGGTAAPWGGSPGSATTFCHERYTPAGRRRLVVVEGLLSAAVVEPAGWAGGRPRVVWEGVADRDWADRPALAVIANLPGPYTIRGGIPDPADRSRCTVPFVLDGVPGTFEYRLADDDTVTVQLLDQARFIAQARVRNAARNSDATKRGR